MINIDEIKNTIQEAKDLHKLHSENANLLDEYEKAKAIIKHYNGENTGEKATHATPPKNASAEISVAQIAESLKTNNPTTPNTEISTDEIYKKLGIK